MTTAPGEVKAVRIESHTEGKRNTKGISKYKVRRHERDRDRDFARAYNSGDWGAIDR